MAETDYNEMVRALERFQERTARSVRPSGGVSRAPGRGDVDSPSATEQTLSEILIPQSPLDVAAMFALGPGRIPLKVGALVAGGLLTSTEAEAGKAGLIRRGAKRIAKLSDAIDTTPPPGIGHNMPPPEAQFARYAEEYPDIGPAKLKLKDKKNPEKGTYLGKELTPEAEQFMKARANIQRDMDEKGFEPYFDPAKRSYVDPANYPAARVDTLDVVPQKAATVAKYQAGVDRPETMQNLEAAFRRGEELGGADRWYAMKQLEDAYIKELGLKAGRTAFLEEFATPMAATTSGNTPQANLLMANYLERQRKLGRSTETPTHEMPATVGGRYAASNVDDYNAMRARGGYEGFTADQPKMHNFTRSFIGDLSRATMDEQMASGMLRGIPKDMIDATRKSAFGLLEKPVHTFATSQARGPMRPGEVQDVAWAGFKNEPGKPMIQTINEAIERTHRLTGMDKGEIVRRALIRKEIPLYGAGGVIGAEALKDLDPKQFTGE